MRQKQVSGATFLQPLFMGILAAFVGYASSFAIVLSGLRAMGATDAQAVSGLFYAALAMGVCGGLLAVWTRTPASVAWSTPGAAFLASSLMLPGGFAEATGAFILCGALIFLTGVVPALAALVTAIPKPVASALLAGVLLKLCFAPALALGAHPHLTVMVLLAWLVGLLWNRLAAMPFAVVAFVAILLWKADAGSAGTVSATLFWPALPGPPLFSFTAFVSVALPLYLVTMAGQNIPGFAVLEMNNYPVARAKLLKTTGLFSLLVAPFGSVPVNMSAITAAMMCGEDAGRDPAKRYWAALTFGVVSVVLAFFSKPIIQFAGNSPAGLLEAVAGLALLPALVTSLTAAFSYPKQLEAPVLTFLITASGMTLLGISGAFWGVVTGVCIWGLKYRCGRAND